MSAIGGLIVLIVLYFLVKSQFKSLFSKDSKSSLHRQIASKDLIIKMQKLRIETLEDRLNDYKAREKQTTAS